MTVIQVPLGQRSYEVHIGRFSADETALRLVAALGQTTAVAVLVDQQVAQASERVTALVEALAKRLPHGQVSTMLLPTGEAAKTLTAIQNTTQWLAEHGYDRGAALVGVGGGAATDHTGFAAAIYLRGIKFACCPTTLLAMVDASVGGKTAVDLPAGKNLVGAFYQPCGIIADLGFLDSLPTRELHAGFAEIVKAGLVADAALFERLEGYARARTHASPAALIDVIATSVQIKADVVAGDERESGRRAILNFGHTVGHALESASHFGLLHGEAIALGMIAALSLGAARGITPPELVRRTSALLAQLQLPTDVHARLSAEVWSHLAVDKKRRSDQVRFVFVPQAGEALLQDVPLAELPAAVTAALLSP